MMKVGMARFYLIGVLAVGATLTWLRVLRAHGDTLRERTDLIVVLGCEAYAFGAGTELRARCAHGAALFHAGLAPRVLASGGLSGGRFAEPEAMRAELVGHGVPPEAIELDPSGASTRRTIATLRRLDLDSAVAVSSRYHLPRIAAEARRQGVPLATSAAPAVNSRARYLRQTAREVAALWWYAITPPRARPPRPRPS
jgi:vancomycin permeability regulator SanA